MSTIETNYPQQMAFIKLNGSQKKKDETVVKGPVRSKWKGWKGTERR